MCASRPARPGPPFSGPPFCELDGRHPRGPQRQLQREHARVAHAVGVGGAARLGRQQRDEPLARGGLPAHDALQQLVLRRGMRGSGLDCVIQEKNSESGWLFVTS